MNSRHDPLYFSSGEDDLSFFANGGYIDVPPKRNFISRFKSRIKRLNKIGGV